MVDICVSTRAGRAGSLWGRWILAVVSLLCAPAASAASPDSLTKPAVAFALRYDAIQEPAPDSVPRDRWIAMDKAKHLGGSALWTLSAQYVFVVKRDWDRGDALPVSVASAGAAGLAKELYDWRVGAARHFSTRDLVADAAGIALAVGVILL